MGRMRGKAYRAGIPRVRHSATTFEAPLRWNKKPWICGECGEQFGFMPVTNRDRTCYTCNAALHRRRVFSLSLGDWLDDEVPIEWLADMLRIMEQCANLNFLLLTKRPENFLPRISEATGWKPENVCLPPNVWFGFSAENQEWFDRRWEAARNIPCKQLFVSFEPLLKPIALPADFFLRNPWGIWGGESGRKPRACYADWIREGVRQFTRNGCPVFVKQMGSNVWSRQDDFRCPMSDLGQRQIQWKAHLKDKKGGDPTEWPADLVVRTFPKETNAPSRTMFHKEQSTTPGTASFLE